MAMSDHSSPKAQTDIHQMHHCQQHMSMRANVACLLDWGQDYFGILGQQTAYISSEELDQKWFWQARSSAVQTKVVVMGQVTSNQNRQLAPVLLAAKDKSAACRGMNLAPYADLECHPEWSTM